MLTFSTGNVCLGDGGWLIGDINISGATVTTSDVNASLADVTVSAGSWAVTDASTPSSVRDLTVSGGTLTGDGELDVSSAFTWTRGTMSGTGSTVLYGMESVIDSGASGSVTLDTRTLSNQGQLTFSRGQISGANGAVIRNSGALTANSEAPSTLRAASGATPQLINTGTIEKTAGTGTTSVGFQIDNQGSVDADSGEIRFSAGGVPTLDGGPLGDPTLCSTPTIPQAGAWTSSATPGASVSLTDGCFTLAGGTAISGTLEINGAEVLAGALEAPDATIYDSSGTLSMRDTASASVVRTLYLSGTLTGPGELEVCGTFTWQAGRMTGLGSTVICPGGAGEVNPPGAPCVALDQRQLINRGTIDWDEGCIGMGPGGLIDNPGRFCLDSDSGTGMEVSSSKESDLPLLINTGDLCHTTPGRTTVEVPTINTGRIDDPQRHIVFSDRSGDDDTDEVWGGAENTPEGRTLSDHASDERRDEDPPISLDEIDEVVEENEPVRQANGNDRYYDAELNVTVITEPGGQHIVTVFTGPDR